MTRQANPHGLLQAAALPHHDAGRLLALSVANSALMDDEDAPVVALALDDAASQGRASPADPKHCHSPGLGQTIWSVQSDAHFSGTWSSNAIPVAFPIPAGRGGHKKAASVGVAPDAYHWMQMAGGQTQPLMVSMDAHATSYGSASSLPTSPTSTDSNTGAFEPIPNAHLLSRSVSPPRRSGLSPRAAPFQSRQPIREQPRYQPNWQQKPAPTPRQMQMRQQFRPQAMQNRATAPGPARPAPVRPTHARSRSDLVVHSMAAKPLLPVVQEVVASAESLQSAIVPPPRCVTPQPFVRPSSTANATMPEGWFAAWAPGPGKRLPSLAEIAARMKQMGKIPPVSPPRTSRATSPLSSPDTIKASVASRNKRYSIESASSTTSSASAADSQYASSVSSATSLDDPAQPVTPYKSRLPPFLQHRRTDSTSTMSSGSTSPTYMTSFHKAARAALLCQSPEKVSATPTCPAVRITPPIETAGIPEPRFTITPPSAGGLNSPPAKTIELQNLPRMSHTPGFHGRAYVNLNDDEDKVQVTASSATGNTQREERGREMLSKLKRRSLEFKA